MATSQSWPLSVNSMIPSSSAFFDDLPRTPSFSWDQLPSLFRRCKDLECRDKTEADFIKTSMEANALSWASVFNSFWALEDQFLEFLGSRKGHSKVYSVGPVNMVNGPAQLRVGDTKADSNNGVISWLDGCDDGSISYVCFGSQKLLTTAQVEALGLALKGWAPHTAILSHRAVAD
ncbi:hypothetical protein OROMI_013630 [Orobanche minor]